MFIFEKKILETPNQQVLYKTVFGLYGKILIAGEGAGVFLRISELFWLEKPSESIESHCQPTPNPCPVYTRVSLCVHLYNIYINP